jgi:Uri superfamily endonuclease
MMKGVYVLVICVSKGISVSVGALGSVNFDKGLYAYVGSAQNGLEKRIERHLRRAKRRFWHVDHLLGNKSAKVIEVFYKEKAGKPEECEIARILSENCVSVAHFGCSDCDCLSHLFMLNESYHSSSSMAFLTANFTRSAHA